MDVQVPGDVKPRKLFDFKMAEDFSSFRSQTAEG